MDLRETGINLGNWVDSAQDRDYWIALVNAALKLRVPLPMVSVSCDYIHEHMSRVSRTHFAKRCGPSETSVTPRPD